MLSNIGFFFLILTFITNIITISCYGFKKKFINEKIFYYSTYLNFISILISFFSLVVCYIISDFSNYNVFENSHSSKPILYKIVGTWGNHEGSMLLWLLIMSLYSFIFSFNRSLSNRLKKITIIFIF